ncbi:hypothetical protein RB195_007658 [Necator americanus]
MTLIIFSLLVLTAAAKEQKSVGPQKAGKLRGSALFEYLKKHQTMFQVEDNPKTKERMKYLMDPKYLVPADKRSGVGAELDESRTNIELDEEPPDRFDARQKWPECFTIGYIRDQSNCGSCWAVSAAETMSDRLCIQSKGRVKRHLSDTDLLSCCTSCGTGCEGGFPLEAWRYVIINGICTGGRYRQKGVCKPYTFHPCDYHENQTYYGDCPEHIWQTPKCEKSCQRGYPVPFKKDKYYGLSVYDVPSDEKSIRREIMKFGPVQASYFVFEDFQYYKNGIYEHTEGDFVGGHSIKIIGWGVENGTNYWLIANSWNTDWGENGYFRMVRGKNDCLLESMVYAGLMMV